MAGNSIMTFGLDISHYQDRGLDLARCRREGVEFVFIKATEGDSFVDPDFVANLAETRAAGLLAAAYHYVRGDASTTAQAEHVTRVVPPGVPIIPDVEQGSGNIGWARTFIDKVRARGRTVPLLYLPRWYWQQIGSPSLAGLPPLWSSRYPDKVVGSIGDEWADVPASYWTGYGGLDVAVLQFTSSAAVAGHQPLDANAFRGSREQLAAVLGVDDMFEQPDRDALNDLAWRLYAVMVGWTNIPKQEGIPQRLWGQPVAISTTIAQLKADVAALKTVPAGAGSPVDYDALADRVAERVADTLLARLGALRFDAEPDTEPAADPAAGFAPPA